MKWKVGIVDAMGKPEIVIVEADNPGEAIAEALDQLGILDPRIAMQHGFVEPADED